MLCFSSFQTISYRFPWCFLMFPSVSMISSGVYTVSPQYFPVSYHFPWCFPMLPLVFLRFPQLFLPFLLSVSPVSYFRFCEALSHFCINRSFQLLSLLKREKSNIICYLRTIFVRRQAALERFLRKFTVKQWQFSYPR